MTRLSFVVYGRPQPAGSKRAFPIRRKSGLMGVAVTDDNPNAGEWKQAVARAGLDALGDHVPPDRFANDPPPLEGPLGVSVRFFLKRPKGHYGTGRNAKRLKDSAPAWPSVKPDATKLLRAVEDALTASDVGVGRRTVPRGAPRPEPAQNALPIAGSAEPSASSQAGLPTA